MPRSYGYMPRRLPLSTMPSKSPYPRPSLDPNIGNGRPRRAPRRPWVRKKRETRLRREAQVTRLVAVVVGDAKARMKYDLARVKDALVAAEEAKEITEEARHKAESEVSQLEVDQKSLLLELGMGKDEVFSLQSQAGKDKEAMEKEYQKALDVIFAYGYECCVLKQRPSRGLRWYALLHRPAAP